MTDKPNIDQKKFAEAMAIFNRRKKADNSDNSLERNIVSEQAANSAKLLKEKNKKEIERFEALLAKSDLTTQKKWQNLLNMPKGVNAAVKLMQDNADISQSKFEKSLTLYEQFFSTQRSREKSRGFDMDR